MVCSVFSTERFVARASRRAASTVVSTFFSAVTAIRLEGQREIHAVPLFSTERAGPTISKSPGRFTNTSWPSFSWAPPALLPQLRLLPSPEPQPVQPPQLAQPPP